MPRVTEHIRHCLFYDLHHGRGATEAAQNICLAYGDGALSKRTCERWFAKFQSGDESLEDGPRQGRPSEIVDEDLELLLKENPRMATRERGDRLGTSHTTVENHLHETGKVLKFGVWIPHDLTEGQLIQRVAICAVHFSPASLSNRFCRILLNLPTSLLPIITYSSLFSTILARNRTKKKPI